MESPLNIRQIKSILYRRSEAVPCAPCKFGCLVSIVMARNNVTTWSNRLVVGEEVPYGARGPGGGIGRFGSSVEVFTDKSIC
jgi:hypothetical protein